jgi:hypothetical protein
MTGDSLPLVLPLSRRATDCETTKLYRELRQPLLRYPVCLGLSADEAQDVAQDAFLSLHRHQASGGSRAKAFVRRPCKAPARPLSPAADIITES